jgi:hypothetical protein
LFLELINSFSSRIGGYGCIRNDDSLAGLNDMDVLVIKLLNDYEAPNPDTFFKTSPENPEAEVDLIDFRFDDLNPNPMTTSEAPTASPESPESLPYLDFEPSPAGTIVPLAVGLSSSSNASEKSNKQFEPFPSHFPVVSSRSSTVISYPEPFMCPIGFDVMVDPVICSDGHTYERKNIQNWLEISNRSPKTNEVMPNSFLIPNHALRAVIEDYMKKNEPPL